MRTIASVLDNVGERLITIGNTTTTEVRDRIVIVSAGADSMGRVHPAFDGRAAHLLDPLRRFEHVTTAAGPQLPITGIEKSTGHTVEIDPADIVSVPLHDADGNPIGVLFPSQPKDVENFVPWASMRNRTSDEYIRPSYERIPASASGSEAVYHHGPFIEAPWAREVRRTGIPPIYVIAHANSAAYTVQVRTKSSLETMFLDGPPHAAAISVNPHVLRAMEGNEYGTLVPISCSPAQHPGSSTGQFAAQYLIDEAEMDRNIHMPRGIMFLGRDEATGQSWLGAEALVTETGIHLPEFDSYWGSPFSSEDKP
ncbi:hypothetical protein [Nocardia rhamnosiphila]|uniref:hypothetical protein n=1 Tax=Nocardia rhamnosiphila TaxID=426716 RepID=UPI0007A42684|nr:hypothetical protein [Nocardia rhamnosiphila]